MKLLMSLFLIVFCFVGILAQSPVKIQGKGFEQYQQVSIKAYDAKTLKL